MPFGTIRLRLTLWYALALIVILAGSGSIWYFYLSRSLFHQIDDQLQVVASELVKFHREQHHESYDNHSQQLDYFVHRHTRGERIQVVDAQGNICCHSDNIFVSHGHIPFSSEALRKAHLGEQLFYDAEIENENTRVISYPQIEDGELHAVILVSTPITSTVTILYDLLGMLLVSSPLAVLAMLWGGWFLSGRALEPINRMNRSIQEIDVDRLNTRLKLQASSDEITLLGNTFNELLDRLQQAFNQIRQFTADASHELRTPLAILRGETEVTLSWGKGEEDYRRTLESNLEEIDRMTRIIEDLLTLSHSESGQAPLNLSHFSLMDFLQSLYEQGTIYGEPRGISIHLNANLKRDVELEADRPRLQQALLNLLTNAIKYSTPNSSVELGLEIRDLEIVIAVRDSGIGIAKHHLPFIFDRFYRVDEARARDAGGAGIGLSITQWIISAHGGRIEVESRPGAGSTFTVILPRTIATGKRL